MTKKKTKQKNHVHTWNTSRNGNNAGEPCAVINTLDGKCIQDEWEEEEEEGKRQNRSSYKTNSFLTILLATCSAAGAFLSFFKSLENPIKNLYVRLKTIYILSALNWSRSRSSNNNSRTGFMCNLSTFKPSKCVWRDQKRRTDLLCICSHDLFLFTIATHTHTYCTAVDFMHEHEKYCGVWNGHKGCWDIHLSLLKKMLLFLVHFPQLAFRWSGP